MAQIERKISHIGELEARLEGEMIARAEERERMSQVIVELRESLQHNQINYVREKDKFEYWGADI